MSLPIQYILIAANLISLLNAQISISFGSGFGDNGLVMGATPVKSVFRSRVIQTSTVIDKDGVAHTQTIKYDSDPTAGDSDLGMNGADVVMKQMENMIGNILNQGFIQPIKPRFRGAIAEPEASSVVIQPVDNTLTDTSIQDDSGLKNTNNVDEAATIKGDTNSSVEQNSNGDAHNPDMTKPIVTVDESHQNKQDDAGDSDTKGDHKDAEAKSNNEDKEKSASLLEVEASKKNDNDILTKHFDYAVISIIIVFSLALYYVLRNFKTCRKDGMSKKEEMRAQLSDPRKRED